MFFGTLAWRRDEKKDVFGYESWWLTSDGTALRMYDLAKKDGLRLPSNPCMSPNFLTSLRSIGPSRSKLDPAIRAQLPVALDVQRYGQELGGLLSEAADEIRASYASDPEWLLRKRARDHVNAIKAAQAEVGGPLSGFADRLVDVDDSGLNEVAEVKK